MISSGNIHFQAALPTLIIQGIKNWALPTSTVAAVLGNTPTEQPEPEKRCLCEFSDEDSSIFFQFFCTQWSPFTHSGSLASNAGNL